MENLHSFTLPSNVKQFSQWDFQDAYVSTILTDQLKAYKNDSAKYIWDKVFPLRPVTKPAGKLASIGFQSMRLTTTLRSARGWANKVEFSAKFDDEYRVKQHALYTDVMTRDIDNPDSPFDAKIDSTTMLKWLMDLSKEGSALQAFDTTVMSWYTTALSGTARFDYGTGAVNPLQTIQYYFKKVKEQCGMEPNGMIISYDVANALVYNADILNVFKYTLNSVTWGAPFYSIANMEEVLSRCFRVPVTIASNQKATITTDIDTATLDYLVSKSILLTFNGGLGKYTNWFGYTFTRKWGQKVLTVDYPPVFQAKDNTVAAVIAMDEYDMVIQDKRCGYLLTDVITG